MSAAVLLEPGEVSAERESTATFVLSLRARGIFDTAVLRAMETVPRDLFAPRRFADLSRSDIALPLACGQTMTGPGTVAAMLAALDLRPGQRVLEVGTGSGYVAALLARIGGEVRTVERQPILAASACHRIAAAGLSAAVETVCGDALVDECVQGRFHRILLNGSTNRVPSGLTSRLVVGGRLVGAAVNGGPPQLLTVQREEDGHLSWALGSSLRIAPLLERPAVHGIRAPETEV